jgi:perosamine synthetase
MTKVQAAAGSVQLRRLDGMNAQRAQRARQRDGLLKDVPELTLPYEPPGSVHTYYLYPMLLPREWAGEKRDRLMEILERDYRVGSMDADAAMYKHRRIVREHTAGQEVPVSDEISARIVCPSLHPLMTEEENAYICAAIVEAVERVKQEG